MKINLNVKYDVEDDDDDKVAIAMEIIQRESEEFVMRLRQSMVDHGLKIDTFELGASEAA